MSAMARNKDRRPRRSWLATRLTTTRRYYASLGGLALMAPLALGVMLSLLPDVTAAPVPNPLVDNANVEGANGTLHVRGALTESACRLDMLSARQDISLGEVGTGSLQTIGARGEPIRFELQLLDCQASAAANRDLRVGSLLWANNQPAVTVSFNGLRDVDNPELVKAQGVSGLGLRLEDQRGRDVRLGSRGAPLMLAPGDNTLSYTVTAERTPARLQAGSYSAVVDFHLSYD